MSKSVWGPNVWSIIHTMAEQITDTAYQHIGNQLFYNIYKICSVLPCPECSTHAIKFLSKINVSSLKNKNDLKNMLYVFHNIVNSRNNKPIFHSNNLEIYKNKNLINVYNNFISVFNTRGNMKLLAESFQRQIVISQFKKWFVQNYHFFIERPKNIQNILESENITL
jgi:hypothetical protein